MVTDEGEVVLIEMGARMQGLNYPNFLSLVQDHSKLSLYLDISIDGGVFEELFSNGNGVERKLYLHK